MSSPALPSSPLPPAEQSAALARHVVSVTAAYTGRGPNKAKAHQSGDLVVVVLQDTLTKAERALVRDGEEKMVRSPCRDVMDHRAVRRRRAARIGARPCPGSDAPTVVRGWIPSYPRGMGEGRSGRWLDAGEAVTLDNCELEPIHLPGRVQAHGAILIVDPGAGNTVLQASANVEQVLALSPDSVVVGRALEQIVGPSATATLLELDPQGPPAVRPELVPLEHGAVMAQCFVPAPGLLGIDLEAAPAEIPGAPAMSRFSAVVAAQLSAARDEDACLAVAIKALKTTTGFDRVWAYRFEADGHGVVVAEDRADHLEPFLGLHFPESDIPQQARAMYVGAGVRLIGDSERDDVPLVPEINPRTGERLDLSGSDLRGVSPIHVRYLRNMGVRTSMSVPIVIDGALWGLLSAHHYGRPQHVSILTRSRCETLGTLTSMQLSAIDRSAAARQDAAVQRHLRALTAHLGSASNATDGLLHTSGALLGLCDADGVLVALGDEVRADGLGRSLSPAAVQRVIDALDASDGGDVVDTDDARSLDPALADLAPDVAGVLAICLSKRHSHWVVWFRSEHEQHITWANRNRELTRRDPDGHLDLGARESFERWAETVSGQSSPWSAAHVEAARDVRGAIGAYALSQAQQLSERAAELARVNEELDAFAYSAAHDLRQPVRAIAMRTEFLLEDAHDRLTPAERDSASAVLRLTGHMGSLVDSLLQYAKLDYAAHQTQRIHLADVLADVRDLLGDAATGARITQDDAVVEADPDTLRQVLFNLVWNALKYSDRPPVIHIGATTVSALPEGKRGSVSLTDTTEADPDVVFVRDNGIGIEADQLDSIFGLFRRLHTTEEYGGGSGAGLALSRRLVQRSGGAIWATSTPGQGSTFYFTTAGSAADVQPA